MTLIDHELIARIRHLEALALEDDESQEGLEAFLTLERLAVDVIADFCDEIERLRGTSS